MSCVCLKNQASRIQYFYLWAALMPSTLPYELYRALASEDFGSGELGRELSTLRA